MADNGRKVRFILLLLLQCAPFVPNPVENRVQLFALPFISWPCWYSFIHSPSASPFSLLSLSLSFLCQLFSLPFALLTLSCDPTPRWIEPLFDNIITESSRCGLKNWFIECFFTPLPFLPCLPTLGCCASCCCSPKPIIALNSNSVSQQQQQCVQKRLYCSVENYEHYPSFDSITISRVEDWKSAWILHAAAKLSSAQNGKVRELCKFKVNTTWVFIVQNTHTHTHTRTYVHACSCVCVSGKHVFILMQLEKSNWRAWWAFSLINCL